MQTWVNFTNGVPIVSDFNTTDGFGTPICIDKTTNTAYCLNGNIVTPFQFNLLVPSPGTVIFGAHTVGGSFIYAHLNDNGTGNPGYIEWSGNAAGTYGYIGALNPGGTRFEIKGDLPFEFIKLPWLLNQELCAYQAITKTAGYTETTAAGEVVVICNLAAGFTVTLPTAVGNKARMTFIKALAAGTITITGAGGQTINGTATQTLTTQYQKLTIISDNANWWLV